MSPSPKRNKELEVYWVKIPTVQTLFPAPQNKNMATHTYNAAVTVTDTSQQYKLQGQWEEVRLSL